MISILDALSLRTVIGISHDWGTYLLSQLAVWHPHRFSKLVFMSVPFSPPGRELDVRKINEATKRKYGYEQYGYQIFLASGEAGKIIGEHVRLVYFLEHFSPFQFSYLLLSVIPRFPVRLAILDGEAKAMIWEGDEIMK